MDAGGSWVATFTVLLSRHVVLEKSDGVSRWNGDDRFFTSVCLLMKYEGGSNRMVKYEGRSSSFPLLTLLLPFIFSIYRSKNVSI